MKCWILLAALFAVSAGQQGSFPATCIPTDPCVRWTVSGNTASFTLSGPAGKYVAMAFGDEPKMRAGSVVYDCIGSSPPVIRTSQNVGTTNRESPENDGQLSNTQATSVDGVLTCQFDADVGSAEQYVLLATGDITGTTKEYHAGTKQASASTVRPNSPALIEVAAEKCKGCRQVHGTFMIIAWVLFAGSGIVMARFYKPLLGERKGTAVWFILHRVFMVFALCLTVIAFIIIFVARDGYSEFDDALEAAHPVLGIIVTLLCIANPIIAAFRCHPGDDKRKIFNYAHWTVGFLAHTAGLMCIVLAFASPILRSAAGSAEWTENVVYFYVAVHFGFFVFMELLHCVYPANTDDNTRKAQPMQSLKMMMMVVYYVVVIIITIVLIIGVWNPAAEM